MSDGGIFDRTAGFSIGDAAALELVRTFTAGFDLTGRRVLDVGCRTGECVRALTRLGADAHGVDRAPRCIAAAQAQEPTGRYAVGDLRDLARLYRPGTFDLVMCVGVLPYTPPDSWMPALRGMGALCAPGGEVRVLLQCPKPRPVQWGIRALSRLPEDVYARGLAPALTIGLLPLAGPLLGRRMRPAELHYRVSLSLYGLHVGVPAALEAWELAVDDCAYITRRQSRAFRIPAAACAAL